MNILFADWHKEVSIEPRSLNLEERWAAVSAAAETATSDDIRELVALACERSDGQSEAGVAFRQRFKTGDSAFAMRRNDREMAVLAGATLVELFANQAPRATVAALAVDCATALAWRPVIKELTTEAEAYLKAAAEASATAPTVHQAPKITVTLPKAARDRMDALPTTGFAGMPAFVADLTSAINAALESSSKAITKLATETVALNSHGLRETDVLWWLLSGRSLKTDSPSWSELSAVEAGLQAAIDLAQLHPDPPGHPRVQALIAQVLLHTDKVDAAELLSAPPRMLNPDEIAAALPGDFNAVEAPTAWETLCPVSAALSKRDGTGDEVGGVTALALSLQLHAELQLAKAMSRLS